MKKVLSLQLNIIVMMRFRIAFVSVFLLFSVFVYGQDMLVNNTNVTIHSDAGLDTLVQIQQEFLLKNKTIDGWRVQIFFEGGNKSYQLALNKKSSFITNYSDIPVYLSFSAPYYKVRVGDYRSRSEAEILLKELKESYPNAFLVKTEINFPKL